MSTPAYSVERLTSARDIVARAQAFGNGAPTAFQTARWLDAIYAELAPSNAATPLGLAISDATTGKAAALVPLTVVSERGLRVAAFPSFGVSDYSAPLVSDAADFDAPKLWAAARSALTGIDLVRLTSMPRVLGAQSNPLSLVPGATPSRHSTNRLTITTTLEEFLHSRGKKYRKEVERCFRLLEKEGPHTFQHAETPEAIARAYAALDEQQGKRRQAAGGGYVLDQPAYSHFYERLLREGAASSTAHILTLESNSEIVAVLMGLTHAGTFTLLRISNGGERWSHLSPGRLVVVEAMRHFLTRGITTFDMGIGDYAFKRGFGIEPEPLVDLVAGLTWRGKAAAALYHAKDRARQSPALRAFAAKVRRQG